MSDKIFISYDNTVEAIDHISSLIISAGKPDVVVGLTRGGLVPAVMLSHKLGVPMTTIQWSTRDYPAKETLESLRNYRHVLIVDDICDTGESLNTLLYDMKVVAPITRVETAVLAVKQNQPYRPNYYWMSIYPKDTDAWVDFFWEK
jgi:hypoxanthine phosphoribosyltransferase